jgi:hypothetical protein
MGLLLLGHLESGAAAPACFFQASCSASIRGRTLLAEVRSVIGDEGGHLTAGESIKRLNQRIRSGALDRGHASHRLGPKAEKGAPADGSRDAGFSEFNRSARGRRC